MKYPRQHKISFFLRFVSTILFVAVLLSNFTVLSAAMPQIKNFINDVIEKKEFLKLLGNTDSKTSGAENTSNTSQSADSQNINSDTNVGKASETKTNRKPIPGNIMLLLAKLYDYDNFTDEQIKQLYDYLEMDFGKRQDQKAEFQLRLSALFDSLNEITKKEFKLGEIMKKKGSFSNCSDADKQHIYEYLNAAPSRTTEIDNFMLSLEKAGYNLFNSALVLQIMAEGIFTYDEAAALFSNHSKRSERDRLVRSVKSFSKNFNIDDLLANNLTAADVKKSAASSARNEKYASTRAEYSYYLSAEVFAVAKNLILNGYKAGDVARALSLAAVLGVSPTAIITDQPANSLKGTASKEAGSYDVTGMPVNFELVDAIISDKNSAKSGANNTSAAGEGIGENDINALLETAEGLGAVLYSSGGSTEPVLGKDIESPFKLNINDSESVSLSTGSVNYSEKLFSIPGVNGLDLELSIDYNLSDANLMEPSYSFYYNTLGYYAIYNTTTYDPSDEEVEVSEDNIIYFEDSTCLTEWLMDVEDRKYIGGGYYYIIEVIDSGELSDGPYYYDYEETPYNKTRNYINYGWSFNIPSIEISDETSAVLHMPGRGSYYCVIDDYEGTISFNENVYDMEIDYYHNSVYNSTYCVTITNGIKYYFSNDGLLTVKEDRYGNSITYTYINISNSIVISKIIDTVGREVVFSYSTNLVNIEIPNQTTITLVRNSNEGLDKIIWQDATETSFSYSYETVPFSIHDKNEYCRTTTAALLATVEYSTGARLVYSYEAASVNFTENGVKRIYRVTERKLIAEGLEYGRISYSYQGNYTNYPSNILYLPYDYTYFTTVNYADGTSTKYTFNYIHLNSIKEYYIGTTLYKKITTTFNYDKLPTRIVTEEYSEGNTRSITEINTYDSKGNVLQHTPPKAEGDYYAVYDTTYTYDSTYSLPLTMTYKQNSTTTIKKQYILSADKKSILAELTYVNNVLKSKTEYVYDSHGNVTQKKDYTDVTTNKFITTTYDYTDNVPERGFGGLYLTSSSVTGVLDADGNPVNGIGIVTSGYRYDIMGRLTHTTDGNGYVTQMSYDARGRMIGVLYPDGTTESFVIDDINNDKTYTDRGGISVKYDYNAIGLLMQMIRLTDNTVIASYTYDSRGNLLEERNAAGENSSSVTVYTYDYKDRVTSKVIKNESGVELYRESCSYTDVDANQNYVVTKTVHGDVNSPDIVTVSYTNKYGETIKQGTVIGGIDTYSSTYSEYNYVGQVIRDYYTNSSGAQVTTGTYTYDHLGNLTSSKNTENNTSYAAYDALGRKTSESDFKGKYVNYTYDNLGRILSQQTPIDSANGVYSVIKYYYDNNGNVVKEMRTNHADNSSDASWSVTEYVYDSVGRVTGIVTHIDSETAQYVHYEYDNAGNMTKMYTGLSVPYSTSLTADNYQLMQYTYNALGQIVILTDALGQNETYTYDDNGYLLTATDRNGNQTRYTYNALGAVVTDAVYSGQTLLSEKSSTYTKTGALRSVSEGGVTMIYAYDEAGRNISVNETGGVLKEYQYDSFGNATLFRLTVDGGVRSIVAYEYDAMLRLVKVTENGDITNYTYDANGNRATMTMSGSSNGTVYTYNDANLVTKLTNKVNGTTVSEFTYTYYTDGNQRTKTDTVNKIITTYVYDGAGRLTSETEFDLASAAIVNRYQYTYDSANNRATMTQDGTETKHIVYSYDKNNRLLSETLISETTEIADTQTAVSETGNKKITTITETRVRTITEETIKTYTYDPNGNTLSITSEDGVIGYTYNARNQQVSYSLDGATLASYTYNPDGLRRSKHVLLTLEQRFIWSGDSMVYECELLYPNNGTVYVYGINLISARNSTGNNTLYLYNAHGDVVQLVDGNGTIIQTYNYDAFGVEYDVGEDDENYFRYAGQYFDTETGTYYLRARYFNPSTGRFTQQDGWAYANIIDPLSLNLYTYCVNNPIPYNDPTGHVIEWVALGLVVLSGLLLSSCLIKDSGEEIESYDNTTYYSSEEEAVQAASAYLYSSLEYTETTDYGAIEAGCYIYKTEDGKYYVGPYYYGDDGSVHIKHNPNNKTDVAVAKVHTHTNGNSKPSKEDMDNAAREGINTYILSLSQENRQSYVYQFNSSRGNEMYSPIKKLPITPLELTVSEKEALDNHIKFLKLFGKR